MALNEAMCRRRRRGASWSRSRTTSDFEIFRPRDSSSMSATSGSGNRTVRVFTRSVYYISGRHARQIERPTEMNGILVAVPLQRKEEGMDLLSNALDSQPMAVPAWSSFCCWPSQLLQCSSGIGVDSCGAGATAITDIQLRPVQPQLGSIKFCDLHDQALTDSD
jgi:hypothetical protein